MFDTRLKELRLLKGDTQASLAEKMGVSSRTIASYEQGINEPSIATLTSLADYFNVTTDYLIGRTEGKTSDLQTLYEEIGLSENSISFLKSLVEVRNAYPPDVSNVAKSIPLPCIDFCLSQGQLSFELFDSIFSYFLVNIADDNNLYISESGDISFSLSGNVEGSYLYQVIPSEYLRDAILQEVSVKLKQLRKLYTDNRPEF